MLTSKMGVLMSNDFNITGLQKKPHPMRCWYCQRTSPKEMTEQMSTFGPDRYIPKSGWSRSSQGRVRVSAICWASGVY